MRLAALSILGLVALFLYAPQELNIILAGFGILGVALLGLGSIGRDRGHR